MARTGKHYWIILGLGILRAQNNGLLIFGFKWYGGCMKMFRKKVKMSDNWNQTSTMLYEPGN